MSMMPLKPGQPGYNRYGDLLSGVLAPPPAPDLNAGFALGAPMQPHHRGFMAPGSKAAMIAGIIGDTLASVSGGQPIFTQNLIAERQRKQELDDRDVQWQRQRSANNEDWQNRQAWELQHKQPTPWEDNAGNRWVTDPATGENKMIFTDRAPKQFIQDGQIVTVQNPYLGGVPTTPQITEDLWNRGTPVGGPAATPGGFPRR